MTFVSYNDMSQANAAGNIMQRFSDELDASAGSFQAYIEGLQIKLRLKNMQQIAEAYLLESAKILEVGSGPLDSNGRSFFTRAFPEKIKSSLYYCDCNPTLAEAFPEVICADMQKLDAIFPADSFESIIGTNALDTLDRGALKETLCRLRKILKLQGQIIHCLNYEPYLYMFLAQALKAHPTAIPFLNEKGGHSILIPQSLWEHPLASIFKKLDSEEKQRLWQGMLTLDNQGYFLSLIQGMAGNRIDSFQLFNEIFTEVSDEAGYKQTLNKIVASEEMVKAPPGVDWGGCRITCGPEGVFLVKDDAIPTDHVQIIMQTHVIVLVVI